MQRKSNVPYYLAGAVALATFIVYLPALQNEFVNWDDYYYVYTNHHIRSLNGTFFKWAFSDFYAGNWHPLTWITHALDYAVWGLNPLGHHLTNIVLHAFNSFFVVLLATRIAESWSASTSKNGASTSLNKPAIFAIGGITGLLFGLHPLHVESAAWVSERKDLLCGLFFLLSLIMYTHFAAALSDGTTRSLSARRLGSKWYLLSLGFFILALTGKPMAVSLPVVLLILDWHPFDRIRSRTELLKAVGEKLPFIALSLVSSIVTLLAQRTGMPLMDVVPLSSRALVSVRSIAWYLGKMAFPVNLVPLYPYPHDIRAVSWEYLVPVVFVAAVTISCVAAARRQKIWLSAWGYYVVTLIPVLGIVQVGAQSMADRYTYLPSIGPFFAVAVAAAWIWVKTTTGERGLLIAGAAGIVAAIMVFIPLSCLTVKQIRIWNNSIDFWSYVINKDPEHVPVAYNDRGLAFEERGHPEKAIEDFTKAIILDPSYADAYWSRGKAYGKIGQADKAIEDYDRAIAINPSNSEIYFSRGLARQKTGRMNEALKDFTRAIALNPSYHAAYNNRGILYAKAGMFDKAIEDFTSSIVHHPGDAKYYSNRGRCYFHSGRFDGALADFNKAIALDPDFVLAYADRADLYLKTGNKELAIADFQKACSLGSDVGCAALHSLSRGRVGPPPAGAGGSP